MSAQINVSKFAIAAAAVVVVFGALAHSRASTAAEMQRPAIPVTGGKTALKPTDRIVNKLNRAKVGVRPTKSATGGPKKLVFPTSGGRVSGDGVDQDDVVQRGTIKHRVSGVKYTKRPSQSTTCGCSHLLTGPTADLGRGVLNFTVKTLADSRADRRGARVIKVFSLSRRRTVRPPSGTIRVRMKVRLTAPGARLFGKLGLNLKAGTKFGILDWIWADLADVGVDTGQ